MLKEMLKRDFGKDLKISNGLGNSVEDPIVLETQSAQEASWTQMEVARCIFRRLGWHWKLVARADVLVVGRRIEKFSCEVIRTDGDEVISETRNFYFDVSCIDLEGQNITPNCSLSLGAGTGMRLPYQFAWFHFDSLINNEQDYPGMGVSVAYSAPFSKATLYIYNKGLLSTGEILTATQVESEFSSATQDFFNANPGAKKISEKMNSNMLFRAFEDGDAYSVLTLSSTGEHFFKLRTTLTPSNEKYTFECLWESVNLILSLMKPK